VLPTPSPAPFPEWEGENSDSSFAMGIRSLGRSLSGAWLRYIVRVMRTSGWCGVGLALGIAVACGGSGQSGAIACDAARPCANGLVCQQGFCVAIDGGAGSGGSGGSGVGGGGGLAGSAGAAGASAAGGTGSVAGAGGFGGDAGATGGGGVAGSGGSPPCIPTVVDDMESGLAGKLPECDGRVGGWFTANDGLTGTTQTPAPLPPSQYAFPYASPGANGSANAIRSYGTCSNASGAWGALLGLALNDSGTGSEAYDAESRGYIGIRFWARNGGGSGSTLRVEFPDLYTDPNAGICTTCFDHWGATITLSSRWTSYTIHWTQLTSGTYGVPNEDFAPTGIFVIQWLFPQGTATFDIYIDNVEFVTS
jgi:hypothetical protein